jgi:hypothetical protein
MEKLKLKIRARYKDGGSLALQDEQGNDYFQYFGIGATTNKGKLYSGHINDKPWSEPLEIEFEIEERNETKNSSL